MGTDRIAFLACTLAATLSAFAGVQLGAPFTDGAVLQRGRSVPGHPLGAFETK